MSRRSILVVEDSGVDRERLRIILEEAGYRVATARDGREGLRKAQAAPPDLIVSDVVMPEMDGYAFCRAVRATGALRGVPLVLVTARCTPADILRGLECGADNFVMKPFEALQLLERLQRIFLNLELRARGSLETELVLHMGGRSLSINADRQQIVELLFATIERADALTAELEASKRLVEDHARNLELEVRQRTAELAAAESQYRSLVEEIPAVLYTASVAETGETVQYVSPQIGSLLGVPAALFMAGPDVWRSHLHPDDRDRVLGEIGRCRAARAPFDCEYRLLAADGRTVWVRDTAGWMPAAPGRAATLRGFVVDVTARRRAEEALERERAQAGQREKLAAMAEMLAGVAHELNNPLSVVLGQAQLLGAAAPPGVLADRAERITRAADRCARIVRNFLALARQHPPARRDTSLNAVVKEALELMGYGLRADTVEVSLRLAENLPLLWADPHQLHQLLVNLVSNAHHALRAVPLPRRLAITTRHDAERGRVILVVSDSGPGMTREVLERLFEPFFTTKPQGQGTGLGLALCRALVESHGGAILTESEPGRGAEFVVELPVAAGPRPARPAAADVEPPPIRGRRILVVDDEPDIGSLLADILALDGHTVDVAPQGAVALERLAQGRYDLISTDLRMPVLDGPGLYREIERRHPDMASRVALVTGDTLGPETRAFLETSGLPALAKPFAAAEVRAVIRKVLGGEPPSGHLSA